MELTSIVNVMLTKNKIGLTYHTSPDGDALGSVLALLQGLRNIGKEAYVISKDLVPENLGFLPFSQEINGMNFSPVEGTDCIITLDCGSVERLSANLADFKGTIINIDHHLSNDKFGEYNYIDISAAATAEIVYRILKLLNSRLDEDIAKCLYTSLVTDTGSFRHSNATTTTHEIAGELLKYSINHSDIHSRIFDNKTQGKLKLIGVVLSNMYLVQDNKVSVMEITKDMVDKIGISLDDSSDIISFGLQIKGVEAAVLLRETDEAIKVSLRSKKDLDVRKVAEVYGGGGHVKASGVTMKNVTISEAKNLILNQIEKEMIVWME